MRSRLRCLVLSLALATGAVASPALAQGPVQPRTQPAPPVSASQVQASTAEARHLSEAFVAVAEHVSPSVVQIDITARNEKADAIAHLFGKAEGDEPIARGMGSGVIFTPDGAILTNNHVVEDALTLNVRLHDGRYLPARLIGRDPATDLAVIKIDATGLPAAKFADSDAARVGEWVVAIGSPFGLGYSVTAGVLSAKGRGGIGMNAIEDYLQTDASINPGNSGGPLCDLQGDVLGINTMIVGKGQGIGFAVPSTMAQRVATQILKTGKVSRAWLGVGVQDISPELGAAMHLVAGSGALVNNVAQDGPAFRANIRPGDVVAAVNGRPVHDGHDLVRETIAQPVGQAIPLEIIRSGQHYSSAVTLAERPEAPVELAPSQQPQPHQGLGLVVRDLTSQQAAQLGLGSRLLPVVTQVAPGSVSDREGLRPGDVIVEVNGTQDPTSAQLAEAGRGPSVLLRVKRADAFFYVALKK